MKRDYDTEGNLLPEAKPSFTPISAVEDLNKNICQDPESFANFKTYVRLLREAVESSK
jgi:hypothetical protein